MAVTVKVARSALRIPLALGERARVRETVMAAATYILGVALTPWPLGEPDQRPLRFARRLREPRPGGPVHCQVLSFKPFRPI
jgi:hypothetical protein